MRHRFTGLLFVALCGLAPALVGSLQHWSPWLWGFMSMVTVSGSLLLVMAFAGNGREPAGTDEPVEPEPAAPPEQPYAETRVSEAPLPSARDGYDFLFSATVWWRAAPDHADWSGSVSPALAVSSVVNRASSVVRHEDPARASFARYLLEGELGFPFTDRSGRVECTVADVTLTLASEDSERLRKLNNLRKDEEVWEHERQYERSKRRYLGDDVLKSTGSAVVWWLARHEEEIEKAVDMIGPLAQVAAAAQDQEVPDLFRHLLVPPVGAHDEATDEFVREEQVSVSERLLLLMEAADLKPDTDGYTVLVHRVMRTLQANGREDAADEIRRRFLLPYDDESDAPSYTAASPSENDVERDWGSPETDDSASAYYWDTPHSPHPPEDPDS
ncbi:hypothetical protein [Streptomyces sp. NBC_00525]|uniref:hypothetical protein n=1 Tax=Streptomyces sp. NBC_00525 TaxID=2903660 RepID=UPI002E807E2B|nr:hypothetical protein [Streptomyces sp. NBC_00525]WUC95765.1 hypothetical protein OG710_20135 [Streptomyces sp. NBC_00525]